MKKILLLFLLFIALQTSFGCDICGCNSGNYFIGPMPQFTKHFVGLRYSFQRYNTVLNSDNTQFSNDFYQTTELLIGTRIKNKWQFLMFVPYSMSHLKSDDGNKRERGLGDLTLNGNYNIMDKLGLNKDTATVSQQLWVGGGIKLPTGKFSVNNEEIVSSANSQPGSGSIDFLLNALYTLQIQSWGVNINVNYKINQSADHFKFGNHFSPTAFVFRSFHAGSLIISPNLGLLDEVSGANVNNHVKVSDTGGNVLLSSIGLEFQYKKIAFGVNSQIPLSSNLSSGQTEAKNRGMCHLSLLF
jgi:hypothetical protein